MAVGQTPSYSQWLSENQDLANQVTSNYATETPQQAPQGLGGLPSASVTPSAQDAQSTSTSSGGSNAIAGLNAAASTVQQRQQMPGFANASAYQSPSHGRVSSDAPGQPIGAPMKPAIGTIMKVVGAIFSFGASAAASKANENAAANASAAQSGSLK